MLQILNSKFTTLIPICLLFISCSAVGAKSYIWKVTKNGANFWIVGVTHFMPRNEFRVPEKLNDLYKHSSLIVVEADFTQKSTYQKKTIRSNIYTESGKVGERLFEQGLVHKYVAEQISKTSTIDLQGLFVQALANFDPSYFHMNVLFEDGLDKQLLARAKRNKKNIGFLENVEQRDELIDTICANSNDHLRMTKSLAAWLNDRENVMQEMVKSQKLLMSGNFSSFENYIIQRINSYDHTKQWFECVIIPRNKNWLEKIASDAEKYNNALILVGASHLVGRDNLLTLFEKSSFLVTNVPLH